MFTPRRLSAVCLLLLCLLSTVLAQGEQPGSALQKANPTNPTVTASAAAERVRFTAPSNIVRMQLQVVSDKGQILFDVSSKGNVLDWSLQDSSGQRLQGSYLAVVTVKSLSGKLNEKIGSISIGEKQVELQRMDATQLAAAQQQAVGPIEENAALTILQWSDAEAITVLANNGSDGQIIRDRGALSFRLGNFFSGADQEQMRLTEEGNLGIGVENPQAKLDVAGTIRATKGIEFADGTVQTTGLSGRKNENGNIVPAAAGTGTQGRLARWTDSSGTLGDSVALDTGTGLQMTSAPNNSADTNLLYLNSTSGTTGVLAGNTPSYGANNGPFFAMRGNTYSTISNQRGLFTIAAGNIASPAGDDGSVKFNTGNDLLRMVIRPSGNVGIGVSSPGSLLDVGGNINTSTQYNIGGNRILGAPGSNNAFVGFEAGKLNSTGAKNSFFGQGAGFSNTAGAENSFFGFEAGIDNGTGQENSFFGSEAGFFNTEGAFNSFVGFQAGHSNTTGGRNSFFGFNAGNTNVDGARNTAIGNAANVGASNLTNATAIGSQAQVDQSDSLVLGSINGVNGATANTKVGIGVTAPTATLTVASLVNGVLDNTATFRNFAIGPNQSHIHYGVNGDWYIRSAVSAGNVIVQDTGGSVGIGTTSPASKLTVKGSSHTSFTIPFRVEDGDGNLTFSVRDDGNVLIGALNPGGFTTHVCYQATVLTHCASAAEYVPTIDSGSGFPETADLVSIAPAVTNPYGDTHGPFAVQKSTTAGDPNLLGFIVKPESGADGPKLNDHYLPLAISGYFPAKVTMENGAIKRGDAITSSSKAGYGMKATSACKIVGYALEDANKEGTIQVFAHHGEYIVPEVAALRAQVQGLKQQIPGATFSDERLKTIKGRFTPGLKALMQLQPVRYEYKPDNALGLQSSGQHIGFGAQAVQKIIPEAVTKNDQGFLLVNNDPILWTMLNAIKEQQKEIADLRLRTEQQQQQLQQKRAHVERLEARLVALEMKVKKMSVKQSKPTRRRT